MHPVEWVILAVVVLGIVIAIFGWDRYRGSRKSAGTGRGSEPPREVDIDAATGQRTRVWYDPATGDREYRAESPAAGLHPWTTTPTAMPTQRRRPGGQSSP